MKPVEIVILGKKYFLKSDEPEKIIETAKFINEKLQDLNRRFNTVDQSKLFVLYALSITQNFFDEQEKNKKLNCDLEQLNDLLENAISDFRSADM
jgi:cell division protein ZapA (FtsZ GTPase activity inhibitor)